MLEVFEASTARLRDGRVERAEARELDRDVLADRLDHQLAVGEPLVVVERGDPREQRGPLGLGQLAAGDGPRGRGLDAGERAGAVGLDRLEEGHVVAGARDRLGDPRPHQAAAEDADAEQLPLWVSLTSLPRF